MSWSSLFAGSALVIFVLVDALWTTVSAQGGGPLSRRFARGAWRLACAGAPAQSARREAAGGVALIGTLWLWVALLWAGWTLVFAADPGAVVQSSTRAPAALPARLYFAGFTVFTLGVGDYVPGGAGWQPLTAVASFSRLFLVTLAITYVLPVVQAVVEKRRLAASIHALGASGGKIAEWATTDREALARQLEAIASALTLHGERHLAYPVVHYFQSAQRRTAVAPNLAALSDALLALHPAVPLSARAVDAALDGYFDVLSGTLPRDRDRSPTPDRAHRLRLLLHQNGWAWPTSDAHE